MRYVDQWDRRARHPMFSQGVWDMVDEVWVVRGLDAKVASWHAAVLSLRYTEIGERSDAAARYLDPPKPVLLNVTVKRTEAALLHMWAREVDGWHGYISYLERDPRDAGRWARASALRPLSQAEIAEFEERQAVRRRMRAPLRPGT